MTNIKLNSVSLTYPVILENGSIRHIIGQILRFDQKEQIRKERVISVCALKQINLEFKSGDRVGLIGRNGAGKSTLLKLISGVYSPTEGSISVEGSVNSLLNLGVGIEIEETGWENILFALQLQGIKGDALHSEAHNVADFTELGDKIHLPVRTYSAGMATRLSFALATNKDPNILVMDEAIGAGDASFQEKVRERTQYLTDKCDILIVASHSDDLITNLCNRVILLDEGEVTADGPPDEILKKYHGL